MPGQFNDNPSGYLAWLREQMNKPGGLSAEDQARLAKAEADAAAAKSDATTAKSDAATAKSTASGASSAAGTAKTTADSALEKANALATDALTSADRQQALRVQVTPDANGRVVFTYPKPYAAGIKPAVTTTAETPNGVSYRNDASVEEGTANNTQVVIIVQRIPRTLTASVLGAVLNIFTPVTTPVWINILVRAPL